MYYALTIPTPNQDRNKLWREGHNFEKLTKFELSHILVRIRRCCYVKLLALEPVQNL